MTRRERKEPFDAAADVIATTPDTAGVNGWRDALIAAAKAYVQAGERMT